MSKEGKGQIKINFVSFEELQQLKGVGKKIAKQICYARRTNRNKLRKDGWKDYPIWDNRNIVRHFDFTPNVDDEPLEEESVYVREKKSSF